MALTKVTYSMIDGLLVNVKDFGVAADGLTDDRANIQAAYDATPDGGTLVFPSSQTLRINSKLIFNRSVNVDFSGCTLLLDNSISPNNHHFNVFSQTDAEVTWTETINQGTYTFTAANTLSVGDSIVLFLGTDPYDPNEQHFVRVCNVISASAAAFTVDVHVPYNINGTTHKYAKITNLVSNVTFKNLNIDYVAGTTPDTNIFAYYIYNVRFENITATKCRILLTVFKSHNVDVVNVDATVVRSGISSHGRVFTGYQLENTSLENIAAYGSDNEQMLFLESWCRGVKIKNLQLNSTNTSQTSAMVWVSGGSYDVEIDGFLFSPATAVDVVGTGGTPSDYRIKNLRMLAQPSFVDMRKVESFADVPKGVSFMGPLGTVQNRAEGTLTTSGTKYVSIANGVLRRLWVYAESITDLAVYVANSNGDVSNITSQLTANQWKEVNAGYNYGGLFAANNPTFPTKTVQLFAGAGFPATQKVSIVAEYWSIDANANTFRVETAF